MQMKNDYRISRALREMAGGYTCANCLAGMARVDASDVTMYLGGVHSRETGIDIMIAPCFRCGQSARVFRQSQGRRPDEPKAISGGAPADLWVFDEALRAAARAKAASTRSRTLRGRDTASREDRDGSQP
jgi:hypothetical protein